MLCHHTPARGEAEAATVAFSRFRNSVGGAAGVVELPGRRRRPPARRSMVRGPGLTTVCHFYARARGAALLAARARRWCSTAPRSDNCGNFLYVEWLRREIMAGRVSLADPGALPQGMGGVYAQFAARQWPDVATFKKDIGPVLDIVAAAREPLTLAFLGEMFDWSERQQIDFQDTLGSLFILPDGRIIPFHKSLLDWLTDRSKSGRYFVSAADGNRRLTEYCVAQYEKDPLALPGYVRGHLPAHLIADKLEAVLTNLAFLEAKTAAAGVFAIVADFADALAAIPPGRPARDCAERQQRQSHRERGLFARRRGRALRRRLGL